MSTTKTAKKVTSKVQREIGKVINDANKAADKLEEQGVPEEVTRLIRPVAGRFDKVNEKRYAERDEKAKRAMALWNNGYSTQEIAVALSVAESTVRSYLAKDDEVITLEGMSTLTLRIREYKREGMSNVAIGDLLGISESTVRRRLKQPLTEEEMLLEAMLDELSNTRDEIIENIMRDPMFSRVFKSDGNWVLRTKTLKRRASFTRREGRGHRMSFTLEFSAYRQPMRKV